MLPHPTKIRPRLFLFTAKELARRFRERGIKLDLRYPDAGLGKAFHRQQVSEAEVRAFWRLKDEVVRLVSHPLYDWPPSLHRARRRLIEYAPCADCAGDPPPDEVIRVGRRRVAVPGQTGTRVAYGQTPLCLRHALKRA